MRYVPLFLLLAACTAAPGSVIYDHEGVNEAKLARDQAECFQEQSTWGGRTEMRCMEEKGYKILSPKPRIY